jgi:hypothetical protein
LDEAALNAHESLKFSVTSAPVLARSRPGAIGPIAHLMHRLGRVHATEHRIDLNPGSKEVHAQPYRAEPRASEIESQEFSRILESSVIEPARNDWASPVVLVPKPEWTSVLRRLPEAQRCGAHVARGREPLERTVKTASPEG